MLKEKSFILGQISLLIDALLTALALWLAFFFWWFLHQLNFNLYFLNYHILPVQKIFTANFRNYALLYLFIVPFFPILYELNGLYRSIGFRSRREIAFIILKSIFIGLLLVAAFIFVAPGFRYISRPLLIGFGGISFILIYVKELIIIEYINRTRELGKNFKDVIVVGVGEIARKAIRLMEQHPAWGFRVMGSAVPKFLKNRKTVNEYPNLGLYDDMAKILKVHQPDLVIFAVDKKYLAEAEGAIYACETQGVETWMIPDFFKISVAKVSFDDFFNLPVMLYRTTPAFSWQLLLKEIIDRVGGLIVFILALPFFVIVPTLIKLTSPGPIFFRQRRNGLRGKQFTMYKFRSMVTNAEQLKSELEIFNEMDGAAFKMTDDPRVTKIGKYLRKASIDEFPQLINVINGEMSLVGPRPLAQSEVDKFKIWQRRRLSMKPGLTCLWQISGRNEVNFEEWMRLDLEYIDNWSIWLDLKILFKTIPIVLIGKGAR